MKRLQCQLLGVVVLSFALGGALSASLERSATVFAQAPRAAATRPVPATPVVASEVRLVDNRGVTRAELSATGDITEFGLNDLSERRRVTIT